MCDGGKMPASRTPPSTVNLPRSGIFAWAVKRGYLATNPIAGMEKLQEQEWAGPKPTDEIVQNVFEKPDPRFLPVYTVIRETGARRVRF